MKFLYTLLLLAAVACSSKDPLDPLTYFTREQQSEIIYKSIRYSAKLPPNCKHEIKFDTAFDYYYKRAAEEYSFLELSKDQDGVFNFLIARPARSITPMFEGIGGQLRLDQKDSLVVYNEVFRTWKMPYKDLTTKGAFLFDRMIKGEDLTLFYSKNAGDQYIEFPDDRFTYNVTLRRWRDNAFDSLQVN